MSTQAEPSHETTLLTKNRVEALADGLFAIVMTLLVLELRVPEVNRHAAAREVLAAMRPLAPVAFSFVVTFALASVFWMTQQTLLNATRKLNRELTWRLSVSWPCSLPYAFGSAGQKTVKRRNHEPSCLMLFFTNS